MFATRAEKPSPNDIEGGKELKQPFIQFWWVEIKSTPELANMKLVASTGKKDEKITILQNDRAIKKGEQLICFEPAKAAKQTLKEKAI